MDENKMNKKSLKNRFKRNVLVNKVSTILLIVFLVFIYIVINLVCKVTDLPQFDLTKNKVYTLSNASKEVIKNVKTKINIAAYGFEPDSNFIRLLKEYVAVNPEYLSYEVLTEESNNAKVQEYGLSQGYVRVVLETEKMYKSIDAKTEFIVYDYNIGAVYDRTEQVITNGILGLDTNQGVKNVYFLTGHGEYEQELIASTVQSLYAENFNPQFINLSAQDIEVGNNDLLVIVSPSSDLNEIELNKIQNMVNKGMNIIYTQDYIDKSLPNFKTLLDGYGVEVQSGYVIENDMDYIFSDSSMFFMPQMSQTNTITSEIYSDGYYMLIAQAGRLKIKDEAELKNLNVTRDDVLYTTEDAIFTPTMDDIDLATASAETGVATIASLLTKNIKTEDGKEVDSKLLILSTGLTLADLPLSSDSATLFSNIGKNKDFMINSISELTDKTNYLKIRKGMDSTTFQATAKESFIVFTICMVMPLVIIVMGFVVSKVRNRRR